MTWRFYTYHKYFEVISARALDWWFNRVDRRYQRYNVEFWTLFNLEFSMSKCVLLSTLKTFHQWTMPSCFMYACIWWTKKKRLEKFRSFVLIIRVYSFSRLKCYSIIPENQFYFRHSSSTNHQISQKLRNEFLRIVLTITRRLLGGFIQCREKPLDTFVAQVSYL